MGWNRTVLLAGLAVAGATGAQAAVPAGRVAVGGMSPALLSGATDLGALPASSPGQFTLVLHGTAAQQAQLAALTAAQLDPGSPSYHRWLTPAAFAGQFGPSPLQVGLVSAWLKASGIEVTGIAASRLSMTIQATPAQMQAAFEATLHRFERRNGDGVIAMNTTPSVPALLGSVVTGIAAVGSATPRPQVVMGPHVRFSHGGWHRVTGAAAGGAQPELDGAVTGDKDLSPTDFQTVYNVRPVWSEGQLGDGQTIALIEGTDIAASDFNDFRSAFGLSGYRGTLVQVHPGCADPGQLRDGNQGEASLDAEWAGAAAPNATIEIASCPATSTQEGIYLALSGLVNQSSPPPIVSISYGGCEAQESPAELAFVDALLQQAASEGITVFAAAGDSLSDSCDRNDDDPIPATTGLSTLFPASSPLVTAVGGTDFSDDAAGTEATYWSATNDSTGGSALGYIPEMSWNNTCASSVLAAYFGYSDPEAFCNSIDGIDFPGLGGGGGGVSTLFGKPSWQSTALPGVPNDGRRDVPDVALFASLSEIWNHALLECDSADNGGGGCSKTATGFGTFSEAGGTSFASPALAGIMALIDERKGVSQGVINPRLYQLAATQFGGAGNAQCLSSNGNATAASCLFHDVNQSDNAPPCLPGSPDCYARPGDALGVLSTSTTSERIAFPATSGWNFVGGLGSVNTTNLVNSW